MPAFYTIGMIVPVNRWQSKPTSVGKLLWVWLQWNKPHDNSELYCFVSNIFHTYHCIVFIPSCNFVIEYYRLMLISYSSRLYGTNDCMALTYLIWLPGSQGDRIDRLKASHLLDPTEIWRYAQPMIIPSLIETNYCLRYAKFSPVQIGGLKTMQFFKFLK